MTVRQARLAVDRQAPLVLDLCLDVPSSTTTARLSVAFTKAFLTVAEQPPDAHRGVDLPAAVLSYGEGEGEARYCNVCLKEGGSMKQNEADARVNTPCLVFLSAIACGHQQVGWLPLGLVVHPKPEERLPVNRGQ